MSRNESDLEGIMLSIQFIMRVKTFLLNERVM